jgi:hypothetical protein
MREADKLTASMSRLSRQFIVLNILNLIDLHGLLRGQIYLNFFLLYSI